MCIRDRAIGIGANTAVFSVLNSVLLRPLPYPQAEQLVSLRLQAPGAEGLADFRDQLRLSGSMYFTFTEQNRTFQSVGVWQRRTVNVTGLAQPEEVCAALISDGVLETLDVPPAVGRWLSHADQDPHSAGPVMLSYGYWQRRFGGDRGADVYKRQTVYGTSLIRTARPRMLLSPPNAACHTALLSTMVPAFLPAPKLGCSATKPRPN